MGSQRAGRKGAWTVDKARRNFFLGLGRATIGAVTLALPPGKASARSDEIGHTPRWAMVIDVRKCVGCQACTVACIMENAVPDNSFRTIVSVYEITENARAGTYMLPRLCNHCSSAPCLPPCPTGATFQRKDGIVVVDNSVCVGCGYCVQACPYDARFINHNTQTADKCTFCAHRVEAGLLPACVETCVGGARLFGDLADPGSTVAKLVAANPVKVLRPEQETGPFVLYIGLSPRFQGKVAGTPTLWHPSAPEPREAL